MARFSMLIFLFLVYTVQAQQLSVLFNTGKANLSSENKKRLDSLVFSFESELEYHITLVGHTDSVGRLKGNQQLSEKRAKVVKQYLLVYDKS